MSPRLILEMFAAIDAGCWESLPRYFATNIVYERPGYDPIQGLEQLTHFYREVRIIATGTHNVQQILTSNGAAACWGQFRGLSRARSVLSERFADVYKVREGLIYVRTTYFFRPAV